MKVMRSEKKTLEEIGNRVPFTVPENYFEDFAKKMEVMTKVDNKTFTIKALSRPWIYLAAMFVGLLVITNILLNVNGAEQSDAISYDQYLSAQMDPTVLADYYLSEE